MIVSITLVTVQRMRVLHTQFRHLNVAQDRRFRVTFGSRFTIGFRLQRCTIGKFIRLNHISKIVPIGVDLLVVNYRRLHFNVSTTPIVERQRVSNQFRIGANYFERIISNIGGIRYLTMGAHVGQAGVVLMMVGIWLQLYQMTANILFTRGLRLLN